MIGTCDALRDEYVGARATRLADLPLRELAHAAAGPEGVLARDRVRAAAVGVSVVVTVRAGADRAFVSPGGAEISPPTRACGTWLRRGWSSPRRAAPR
jgi:hypothetical protein